MSIYNEIIMEATGCDAPTSIALEELMRHVIFHSTLSWQTMEQLRQGAVDALELFNEMEDEDRAFYLREG